MCAAMAQPTKKRRMEVPPPAHAEILLLAKHQVALPQGVTLSPGAAHSCRVALAVSAVLGRTAAAAANACRLQSPAVAPS